MVSQRSDAGALALAQICAATIATDDDLSPEPGSEWTDAPLDMMGTRAQERVEHIGQG